MFGAILSRVCRFRAHKSSLHPDQHLLYPDFSLARRRDMPAPRWIHSHHAQPIADSSQMSLSMSHHSDLHLLHTGVLRSPQSLLLDTSLLPPHEPLALRESLSHLHSTSSLRSRVSSCTRQTFPGPRLSSFSLKDPLTSASHAYYFLQRCPMHAVSNRLPLRQGLLFVLAGILSHEPCLHNPLLSSHICFSQNRLRNQFLSSLHDETSLLNSFLSTLFHACCCSRQPSHHVSSIFCALL